MRYDHERIRDQRIEGETWPDIAAEFGVNPEAVRGSHRRWVTRAEAREVEPGTQDANGLTASRVLTKADIARITSLEDLIDFFDVDTDAWEVRDYRVNSWEQNSAAKGLVTLYQVRANLIPKRERQIEVIRQACADFVQDAASHAPDYKPVPRAESFGEGNPVLMEIAIHDPHFGMLAWGREVGGTPYDLTIAERDYAAAVAHLLSFGRLYNVEKILYILGQDMAHINQTGENRRGGATAKGTPQDVDGRMAKIFTTVRRASVSGIDQARMIAPVDVEVVLGNHDPDEMYKMGEVMNAWYRNDEEVEVGYGPNTRRFYGYGKNAFMLCHGEGIMRQRENLPMIMLSECPIELLAASEGGVREIHTGHFHKNMQGKYTPTSEVDESREVRVRALPGLTAVDSWHHDQGYSHKRRATVLFWYRDGGLAGYHEFTL